MLTCVNNSGYIADVSLTELSCVIADMCHWQCWHVSLTVLMSHLSVVLLFVYEVVLSLGLKQFGLHLLNVAGPVLYGATDRLQSLVVWGDRTHALHLQLRHHLRPHLTQLQRHRHSDTVRVWTPPPSTHYPARATHRHSDIVTQWEFGHHLRPHITQLQHHTDTVT